MYNYYITLTVHQFHQMEVLYRKSEQQNQTLKNELSSMIQCRNQLREEKNKLGTLSIYPPTCTCTCT